MNNIKLKILFVLKVYFLYVPHVTLKVNTWLTFYRLAHTNKFQFTEHKLHVCLQVSVKTEKDGEK